jgi:uncharacterized protein
MKKEVALITGASSGIGLEMAWEFAKNDCDLVLIARSEDKLIALSKELKTTFNIQCYVFPCDLTQTDAAKTVFDFLEKENIHVDFLINNAGVGDFGWFKDSILPKNQQMIDLNISSLVQLTHLIIPQMIARKKGRIMQVASTAAFQPGPYMAVYFATKAFVLSFSEALNNELSEYGITVTALCPGPTQSGFAAAAGNTNNGLFDSKVPTSAEVAHYGYKALMRGKAVAIHGAKNNFLVTLVRFTPRNLVVKIARKMMGK